jgi:CSLREA domain-containing protein
MEKGFARSIAFSVLAIASFIGSIEQALATQVCQSQYRVTKTADTNDGTCSASDCSLREAIQAANRCSGGQYVLLPAGTFLISRSDGNPDGQDDTNATGDLDILGPVGIRGSGTGQTIIDGQALHRIFDVHVGYSTISDLTLSRGAALHLGNTYHDGGALRVGSSQNVSLSNVRIRDSYADHANGAAALNVEGALTAVDSVIEGNVSLSGTSVMKVGSNSFALFTRVVVVDNWSLGNFTVQNFGQFYVRDSSFQHNVVTGPKGWAGAIDNRNQLVIERSRFQDNVGVYAGAIFGGAGPLAPSTITVTDSTFRRNEASSPGSDGGAIANFGSTSISRSFFDANIAGEYGGSLLLGGPSSVVDSVIRNSRSGVAGGGIAFIPTQPGDLVIQRSYIGGNQSVSGGGLYTRGSSGNVKIVNATIHGNIATYRLGAGLHSGRGRVDLKNVTFTDNSAAQGITLYGEPGSQFRVSHTVVSGAPNAECLIGGTLTSYGYNRSGNAGSGCVFDHPTDLGAGNPMLDGITYGTMPIGAPSAQTAMPVRRPQSGSSLINRGSYLTDPSGDADREGCAASDVLGIQRPQLGVCDIGAIESTVL